MSVPIELSRNQKSRVIHKPLHFLRGVAGVTLIELITVIAVLGILSAVVITSYTGVRESAQATMAEDNVVTLNHALLHFNQANWDIVLTANSSDTSDELAVLHTLKWRDPDASKATPGSPYIAANFNEAVSSSQDDYRIRWNGSTFELLLPGTAGSGLQTGFDSNNGNQAYSFPANYQPIGPGQK